MSSITASSEVSFAPTLVSYVPVSPARFPRLPEGSFRVAVMLSGLVGHAVYVGPRNRWWCAAPICATWWCSRTTGGPTPE